MTQQTHILNNRNGKRVSILVLIVISFYTRFVENFEQYRKSYNCPIEK